MSPCVQAIGGRRTNEATRGGAGKGRGARGWVEPESGPPTLLRRVLGAASRRSPRDGAPREGGRQASEAGPGRRGARGPAERRGAGDPARSRTGASARTSPRIRRALWAPQAPHRGPAPPSAWKKVAGRGWMGEFGGGRGGPCSHGLARDRLSCAARRLAPKRSSSSRPPSSRSSSCSWPTSRRL